MYSVLLISEELLVCSISHNFHLKFVLHFSIYILAQILVHLHVWLFSCNLKFPVCSCNCCAHNSVVISNIDWFYNKSLSTVFTVLYILYVHLPSVTCLPIKISRYLTEWWKFAIGGGNLVFVHSVLALDEVLLWLHNQILNNIFFF